MAAFLWTVVILMAAALLAEILAFVGMALVARRAARRATEISGQISQSAQASIHLVNEIRQAIQPRVGTISQDTREAALILTSRYQTMQAALSDASRRAERFRLRLNDSVQTVEEQRRAVYREVVEPVQAAGQVLRGIKLALWLLRRVA